ncbi:hypothetical protein AB0F81_01300 [Actinoplanes sp. NPDC024001]
MTLARLAVLDLQRNPMPVLRAIGDYCRANHADEAEQWHARGVDVYGDFF